MDENNKLMIPKKATINVNNNEIHIHESKSKKSKTDAAKAEAFIKGIMPADIVNDIKLFDEHSLCPKCRSKCKILNGIEVGHIFKLGDNYSELYDLKYTDEKNELNFVHMGSYGIGIDRCINSIAEKHHDDLGIIWPMNVAPFKVAIIVANVNDKDTFKYAKNLYTKLNSMEIDCLLDDRKERPGVKFNDMDLIGIPIRITVGKKINENEKICSQCGSNLQDKK